MNININGNVNIAMKKEFFQQLLFLSSDAQSLVRIRYLYLVHVCGTDFSSFLNSIFLSFAEPPFHALRAKKMDIYSTNQIASTHMDVNIAKVENTMQRNYLIVQKYYFLSVLNEGGWWVGSPIQDLALKNCCFFLERTKINCEGNINIKLILFHHVTQMLCENESSLIIFCLCVYSQHSPGKSQLMNIKHVFAQFMHGHLFRKKSASSIFSRFSPIISSLC